MASREDLLSGIPECWRAEANSVLNEKGEHVRFKKVACRFDFESKSIRQASVPMPFEFPDLEEDTWWVLAWITGQGEQGWSFARASPPIAKTPGEMAAALSIILPTQDPADVWFTRMLETLRSESEGASSDALSALQHLERAYTAAESGEFHEAMRHTFSAGALIERDRLRPALERAATSIAQHEGAPKRWRVLVEAMVKQCNFEDCKIPKKGRVLERFEGRKRRGQAFDLVEWHGRFHFPERDPLRWDEFGGFVKDAQGKLR